MKGRAKVQEPEPAITGSSCLISHKPRNSELTSGMHGIQILCSLRTSTPTAPLPKLRNMQVRLEVTTLSLSLRSLLRRTVFEHLLTARLAWFVYPIAGNRNTKYLLFQSTPSPINLAQIFLSQTVKSLTPVHQSPLSSSSRLPGVRGKVSKGVKAFPDGWRQVLNNAKDIMRCSILLDDPFPGPSNARVMVTESFHEAYGTECDAGLVLEDGMFYPNEVTRCY